MADLKITDLGSALSVDPSDYLVVDTGVDTLKATAGVLRNAMTGDISTLTTTAKSSAVAAINELDAQAKNKVLFLTNVACSATTGNFASVSDAKITSDHVVVECVFANPSAITSDVTCTTGTGTLTLNGTCASATTATITLVKKDN